ncbi:MAG: PTS sugar transporter subunit IIC [Candidatus Latescibacterota bacterium]
MSRAALAAVTEPFMDYFLLLGVLGGALAVDDKAGWQSLLAQPIFAALLVGLLFGQIAAGLMIGLFLELIWLAVLPMRGMKRPDQVCGAIVGASAACYLIHETGDPRFTFVVALGVLIGLFAGEFAARASVPLFKVRERRLARVGAYGKMDGWQPMRSILWIHIFATAYIFLVEMMIVLVSLLIAGVFARWVSSSAGSLAIRAIENWGLILPAFGVSSLVHVFWHKHLTRFLILSGLLALFILWIK